MIIILMMSDNKLLFAVLFLTITLNGQCFLQASQESTTTQPTKPQPHSALLYQQNPLNKNNCSISCIKERFDIGKDCVDADNVRCQCIGHCCWSFDCRLWPVFAQCRKKCKIRDWSHFGANRGPVECNHFPCYEHYLMAWDYRNVTNSRHINCIKHCCYAFNCKKFSGYCREMCIR